jgi:tetratricopeptide (TPR) repeat protein
MLAARWMVLNNQPERAIKTLNRAVDVNRHCEDVSLTPERTRLLIELHIRLLEMLLDQQDWARCAAICEDILKFNPRHHFALEILATAHLQSGEVALAAAVMQRLLQVSPNDPLHRLKYATLLQLCGDTGAALREYGRVLASHPSAPFAGDARDAIELLDNMQIQQIMVLAAEHTIFRLQLQRTLDQALSDNGFALSESGRESLRHMIDDGRMAAEPQAPRIH